MVIVSNKYKHFIALYPNGKVHWIEISASFLIHCTYHTTLQHHTSHVVVKEMSFHFKVDTFTYE